jgi:hypothetical protein
MASALACAIWDHAVQLALVAHYAPPSLVAECFRWAKIEMRHTHVDPWEGLLAQVWGI